MTARWPDPDRAIIGRHVASLDLRSMKSRTCYRHVLHGFQDVAERYEALDQEVLLAWLRESAIRRAASTLLHRTRIIDRFLERLVEIGAIQGNPVAALRDECNIKQCMPIWRALGSRDPEQALAELLQPRPFGSVLGEMMADHVAMMRRRGYKYTSQPLLLLRFDRFLQLHPGPEAEPLNAMIDRWAATNVTRHYAEECEKLKRVFAKILRHRDPSTPVRRPDPRPRKEAAKQWRKPHIYSPADVRRMLEVARSYPSPRAPLRPLSMYTMLLLACQSASKRDPLSACKRGPPGGVALGLITGTDFALGLA